jgi:hypothetical protein
LALVVVWLSWRAAGERDDPTEVLRALRASSGPTLPEPATCKASSRSAIEHYDRDSLYTFIDGAAEAYLAQGFERCAAATYAFGGAESPSVDVAAEVYRFREPAGAARLFAGERPGEARAVDGVPAAVTDGTVLLAVSGRDYLKLTLLGRSGDSAAILAQLAAAWRGGRDP